MEFQLPELGEGVHEGELVKWRVKPGDMIAHDQPICEVMTDKATIEVPAPFDGKITSIGPKEGTIVKVGQTLVSYEGKGAVASAASTAKSPPPAASTPLAKSPAPTIVAKPAAMSTAAASDPATRPLAAPATRKYARESGVELSTVSGSGPHGRILRDDIDGLLKGSGGVARAPVAARSQIPAGELEVRKPFMGLRKKISEKMRLSKDHAAHFTYVEEADVAQLVKLRTTAKELAAQQGVKLTYLPFIMKAMVAALKKYPILNSSLDEATGEIVYKNYYNIGLSVQTDDGLTAPVIKNVDQKSIYEIAADIQAVVERARTKKLTGEDLKGGTITLTNAGTIGGLFATPIINYPEVAILGFNKIFRKPVVKTIRGREKIVVRDWTYFSLSLDHRIVDGAIGAEFTKQFIQYIENPITLFLG